MYKLKTSANFYVGGSGTSNYEDLENKPSINNVELEGNKSLSDLGIDQDFVKDNNYVHTDNNYTTEEKTKLSNLENYDDTQVKADITSLSTNKADKSEIPDVSNFITKSVNDLVNYYLKSETYTKTEVNSLISAITTISFEVVNELPQAGQSNIIYLVPSTDPKTQNVKDEYIWINNNWEKIGSTDIDLSNYVTTTQLNTALADYTTTANLTTLLAGKQDALVSGTNIKTINNTSVLGSGDLTISGYEGDLPVYLLGYGTNDTSTTLELSTLKRGIYKPKYQKYGIGFTLNGDSTQISASSNSLMSDLIVFKTFEEAELNEKFAVAMLWRDNASPRTITAYFKKTNATTAWNAISFGIDGSIPNYGYPQFALTNDTTQIYGNWIFQTLPQISTTPSYNDEVANKKYVDNTTNAIKVQYSTMPTASSTNVGQIVQYIGTTDSTYTNGYFYQCVSDGQSTPTYSWENVNVQASSGGTSGNPITILGDNTTYSNIAIPLENLKVGIYKPQFEKTSVRLTLNGVSQMNFDLIGDLIVLKDYSEAQNNEIFAIAKRWNSSSNPKISTYYLKKTASGVDYDYSRIGSLPNTGNDIYINSLEDKYLSMKWSFNTLPESSYAPTNNYQFTNKKYVDDSIASAITTTLGGSY